MKRALRSSATMMYGNLETPADRVEHLIRLGIYRTPPAASPRLPPGTPNPTGSPRSLSTQRRPLRGLPAGASHLRASCFDNIVNLQTSYVTQGSKLAQVSLHYGANDFGGTMIEENVVSAAGCFNLESIPGLEAQISGAGFSPRQRNSWYGLINPAKDEPLAPPAAKRQPPTAQPPRAGSAQSPSNSL